MGAYVCVVRPRALAVRAAFGRQMTSRAIAHACGDQGDVALQARILAA